MRSIGNIFVNNTMHNKIETIDSYAIQGGVYYILIFMKKVPMNSIHPQRNIKCLILLICESLQFMVL